MQRGKAWRRFLVLLVTVFAFLYVLPTLAGKENLPGWYTSIFSKTLQYGLDLQGGLELRFAVDYKKAIRSNTNRIRDGIVTRLAEEKARKEGKDPASMSFDELDEYRKHFKSRLVDYASFTIEFESEQDAKLLDSDFVNRWAPRYAVVSRGERSVTLAMSDDEIAKLRENIVDETLKVIRKRIDAFGLTEPDVRRVGETDIDVQLPGVDKEHMDVVRQRLGQTAQLAFRLLDTKTDFFADKKDALEKYKQQYPARARTLAIKRDPVYGKTTVTAQSKAELVAFVNTLDVPDDHMIGYEFVEVRKGGVVQESYWKALYLFAKADLTGEYLTRAQVLPDPQEGWYVSLEFNSEGARIFADLTEKHVGDLMAIMLDDEVSSAPRIKEPIRGGRARITMGGNRPPNEVLQEARALVTVLNHGAYRAPVHKVHDEEVGPTLGADAIASGKLSLVVGFSLVVVFISVYYKLSGVLAVITLLMNLLFLTATLINFGAALTLPGLAGLVLTVGMAVDANVLIFERIREEIRDGKRPKAAVDAGFSRAFWTIFDANLTTALTAVILMNFTSGPIYGFAVVLLTGIVYSVLTAYYGGRMLFDMVLERRRGKPLSI